MSESSEPSPALPRIRLGLSPDEWRELEVYVRRHYRDLPDFFTRKALELIATCRHQAGRPLN